MSASPATTWSDVCLNACSVRRPESERNETTTTINPRHTTRSMTTANSRTRRSVFFPSNLRLAATSEQVSVYAVDRDNITRRGGLRPADDTRYKLITINTWLRARSRIPKPALVHVRSVLLMTTLSIAYKSVYYPCTIRYGRGNIGNDVV